MAIPVLFTQGYCSLNPPLYVYMAPRFYLYRAVATLRITDCLDAPCLFCFRPCPYCFRPWLPNPTLGLLHTSWLCQFTDTCLLTGPYDLGISAWLAPIRMYPNPLNHYQKAYACGYTLDIALEISTFVLTLTLLLFCWPQAAPSIWPLALSSWTTNPHTLRHKNCFETNCLF